MKPAAHEPDNFLSDEWQAAQLATLEGTQRELAGVVEQFWSSADKLPEFREAIETAERRLAKLDGRLDGQLEAFRREAKDRRAELEVFVKSLIERAAQLTGHAPLWELLRSMEEGGEDHARRIGGLEENHAALTGRLEDIGSRAAQLHERFETFVSEEITRREQEAQEFRRVIAEQAEEIQCVPGEWSRECANVADQLADLQKWREQRVHADRGLGEWMRKREGYESNLSQQNLEVNRRLKNLERAQAKLAEFIEWFRGSKGLGRVFGGPTKRQ